MPVDKCDRLKLTHRVNKALYRAESAGEVKIGPIGISPSTADFIFNSFREIGTYSTLSRTLSNVVPVNYDIPLSEQVVRKTRISVYEISMTLRDPTLLDFLLGPGWYSIPIGESDSSLLYNFANTVTGGSDIVLKYCIETNDLWIELCLEQTLLLNNGSMVVYTPPGSDVIDQENNSSDETAIVFTKSVKRRRPETPTKASKP